MSKPDLNVAELETLYGLLVIKIGCHQIGQVVVQLHEERVTFGLANNALDPTHTISGNDEIRQDLCQVGRSGKIERNQANEYTRQH